MPTLVSTANPMDHMTRRIAEIAEKESKKSGVNRIPVIGMGSALDSTRLRDITAELLKEQLGENIKIENAFARGGHDDTSVPIFSQMTINGQPATDYLTEDNQSYITNKMRARGGEIKKRDWKL